MCSLELLIADFLADFLFQFESVLDTELVRLEQQFAHLDGLLHCFVCIEQLSAISQILQFLFRLTRRFQVLLG